MARSRKKKNKTKTAQRRRPAKKKAGSAKAKQLKPPIASDSQAAFERLVFLGASSQPTVGPSLTAESPTAAVGDLQLQVDVYSCILDAMTDCFPVTRASIEAATVPSKPPIGADGQGWGICLALFGEYLARLRPFYAFYVHKPAYTIATLDQPFAVIVMYLKERVRGQFYGTE